MHEAAQRAAVPLDAFAECVEWQRAIGELNAAKRLNPEVQHELGVIHIAEALKITGKGNTATPQLAWMFRANGARRRVWRTKKLSLLYHDLNSVTGEDGIIHQIVNHKRAEAWRNNPKSAACGKCWIK